MILSYQQQLDLVDKGLAKASINGKFATFKYAKRVMYDYLWDQHPEMKYCRGQTYDSTNGTLVTLPPAKTFNYLENGTWADKALDTPVLLYKKYNGFMAALSIYKGEIIVSTTGTTNSDYAELAKKEIFKEYPEYLVKDWAAAHGNSNATWLFEICHESDPHIVNEKLGVHYLGCSTHEEDYFDEPAGNFTPMGTAIRTWLGAALQLAKEDTGEGWMVYTASGDVCKLKTDYYVGKKKLMRMNKSSVDSMYNTSQVANKLPDQWSNAPQWITSKFSKSDWQIMSDQERRVLLEYWWDNIKE